jgi:hypothetical protein
VGGWPIGLIDRSIHLARLLSAMSTPRPDTCIRQTTNHHTQLNPTLPNQQPTQSTNRMRIMSAAGFPALLLLVLAALTSAFVPAPRLPQAPVVARRTTTREVNTYVPVCCAVLCCMLYVYTRSLGRCFGGSLLVMVSTDRRVQSSKASQ